MARIGATPLPTHSRPVNPRAVVGAGILVVIIGALFVTGLLGRIIDRVTGQAGTTPAYQTAVVQRGSISVNVTATGPVTAVDQLPLTFKSSGKLASIDVAVGQQVTKGQKLATLDPTDLNIALDQAKASLTQGQANLANVEAGATSTQKQVAQASVNAAKKTASDAQASLATSQQSAAKSVAVSSAGVQSASTSLASAKAALASTQNEATKQLAADQAAVTNAQKNLTAVQASVAANQPILEQGVAKAKDDLWSAQISRDATCGHGGGGACNAANASVAGAQTAVNTAQAQLVSGVKQGAQQIASAQASLQQAQSTLANDQAKLNASIVSAQNQVKQSQDALSSAQASLAQAQTSATATVQNAQNQVNQDQSQVKSAQASYAQTVAPPTQSAIETAKAQVVNAQAAVQQAQNNLDAAVLYAPFSGTVAAINGTVGQWITGGPVNANASVSPSALITLVNLSNLQVTAQVNEADIAKVKVGDPVNFTVNAFPGKTFVGKVEDIEPIGTVTQNVVNYNVLSSINPTKDASLYPGMTATVNIISAQKSNTIVVPNTALSFPATAFRDGLIKAPNRAGATPAGRASAAGQATARSGGSRPSGATGAAGARAGFARSGNAAGRGFGGANGGAANRGMVVVLKQGQLTPAPVTLGITDGTNTQIVSGIQAGEVIVTGSSGGSVSPSTAPANGRGGRGPGGPFGRFGG